MWPFYFQSIHPSWNQLQVLNTGAFPSLPKNSAEEKVDFFLFGVVGGREERPGGFSRHAAAVLNCSARSGPEKKNIKQEPAVIRSRAAEGLLCTGSWWLCLAEHPLTSGPGLPSPECIRPYGHGPVAALRLQDKGNYRDSAETWMSGDTSAWKLHWEAAWRTSPQHLNGLGTVESYGGLLVSVHGRCQSTRCSLPLASHLSLGHLECKKCLLWEASLLPQQPRSLGQPLAVSASGASLPAGRSSWWAEAAGEAIRDRWQHYRHMGHILQCPLWPEEVGSCCLVGDDQQPEETLQTAVCKRLQAFAAPLINVRARINLIMEKLLIGLTWKDGPKISTCVEKAVL